MCTIVLNVVLSGCVAKDLASTEQQKRMQRCEQYVDREREACLNGGFVSIQDYKDEYEAFERSKKVEQKKNAIKIPESVIVPKIIEQHPQPKK